MLDFTEAAKNTELQHYAWPPVNEGGMDSRFREFIALRPEEQRQLLQGQRDDPERHGEMIHRLLDSVSAYIFGYPDSPIYGRCDAELETALLTAKILLESELLEHWLKVEPVGRIESTEDACEIISTICRESPSCNHPLFDFLEKEASQEAFATFLRTDVMRNEIVDDEVSLCVCGLQGNMKLAMVSNLWDECGRGKLKGFHTYWLRRLIESQDDWMGIRKYRAEERPWFTQITTNVFNVFLTRPGIRMAAYGWFGTNESWVAPHFEKIVEGLKRCDLYVPDVSIYFDAHIKIDPNHTAELLQGLRTQTPALSRAELETVVYGARAAAAATLAQYDRMHRYLVGISGGATGA